MHNAKEGYSDIIEESTANSAEAGSSNREISLVAEFDDLTRTYRQLAEAKAETEASFMDLSEQTKLLYVEYFRVLDDRKRLQDLAEKTTLEWNDLNHKVLKARKVIDEQKLTTWNERKKRDDLLKLVGQVRGVIFKDKGPLSRLSIEEIRDDLSVEEINPTGNYLIQDSRSEEELDSLHMENGKKWKKHRSSTGGVAEPALMGQCTLHSKVVEIGASDTVPVVPGCPTSPPNGGSDEPPANLVFESGGGDSPQKRGKNLNREHTFQQKIVVMPDTCGPCQKRIHFGNAALKCKDYWLTLINVENTLPPSRLQQTADTKELVSAADRWPPTICTGRYANREATGSGMYG